MSCVIRNSHLRRCALLSFLSGVWIMASADGLPGEYLLSSRWRDLLARHSSLTNPAFLTQEEFLTVRGAFSPTMQGAFKLWETGVTVPLGRTRTAGFTILGENDGEIESAVFDETNNRLIAGEQSYDNNNLFFMLTYAQTVAGRLSAGVNLNFAYQSNFETPIMGIGLDLGCAYLLLDDTRAGNHTLGISTVNLIAPSMSQSFSVDPGNEGEYSRDLKLSWMGKFRDEMFESGLDIALRDFLSDENDFRTGGKALEWAGSWRLGLWLMRALNTYVQLGFGERAIEYWGVAAGIKLPLSDDGRRISSLYQYNLKTEGERASTHTVYLVMNFGKSRKKAFTDSSSGSTWVRASEIIRDKLAGLKRIDGLTVEEEQEYVRITAREVAVHFASGSAEVPPEATKVLTEIAGFLKSYPNHPVSIEGHTDSDPITGRLKQQYPDNVSLSRARAEKVKDYFVDTEKLPQTTFSVRGFGETKPIAPNDTKESKYKNRRVVILIKK